MRGLKFIYKYGHTKLTLLMAAILSQVSPVLNTNTVVYTVPAAKYSVLTINICSLSNLGANVWVGISSNSSPSAAEWIRYESPISITEPLKLSGVVVPSGKSVVVKTSASCSVAVWGFEE